MAASRLYCPPEEFTFRLRQRLPMNVGFTFTSEQLDALRSAFGDRFERQHAIDMRGRVYLPWSRYYLVIQAGRDRRPETRHKFISKRGRTVLDSILCGLAAGGLGSFAILWALHVLH